MTQASALALAPPDPDDNSFAHLGIADPEIGRLLETAFSQLIGNASGSRTFTELLCMALAGIARLEFRHPNGALEPAPAPELPSSGWLEGEKPARRFRPEPSALDRAWSIARARDGIHARLELETVEAFFPAGIWQIAERILEWGPAETCERLERFCRLEAMRPIKPTRARPEGGTVSAGTIDALIVSTRRLLAVFCDLRSRGYPSPALARWQVLPGRISAVDLEAVDAHTDRSAPPLALVRRVLRELDREIMRRAATARGAQRLERLLRKRLLVGLLAATGARIGALAATCVRDYDPAHLFPDGTAGPALRLFPGKTISPSAARWKALSADLAGWLEHHLSYLDIAHDPDAPLFPSPRKAGKAMTTDALSFSLSGNRGKHVLMPLLPREEGSDYGYSAHTLRHLTEQLAYEVGHDYLLENQGAKSFITPQVLADALLDHQMSSDRLGYKDLDTPEGRERWARVAGLGVWEYVWGDKGARQAPDQERIERAVARRDEIGAERAALQTRIDELRERRREIEGRGECATALSTDELVRLLFQLSAIAGALDDEHEEVERLQRAIYETELELRAAQQALVPLPDDAPDTDKLTLVELTLEAPAEPLRDWLTPIEAARAFGVSEPTIRRWLRGQLPHAEGDPRNPWQPSEVENVVERHGPRKQRLIVSRLDRSRIAPEVMRTINELLMLPPTAPR